jgi:23S rRNA pseudouridine1911/1915/1917 synthase
VKGEREPTPEADRGEGERRERIEVAEAPGERIDRWLADRLGLSRSRVASLIGEGRVRVDGRVPKKSDEPGAGEVVEVEVPPRPEPSLEAQDLPIGIVHEDDDLVVVEKPSGMVVHPAPGHPDGTLVNALLARVDRLSRIGGDTRPGIVHRLDKETSGLLVVAKDEDAHRALQSAIADREVERGYLAGAWGRMDRGAMTVDRPIGRDPNERTKMAVVEDGKRAVTHMKRIESWISAELWAVKLETGRTHQIRVHLRELGHPVVRDDVYAPGWEKGFVGAGGRWAEEFAGRCGRLFLHAAKLSFEHPRTGETLTFTSALPPPLDDALEWARESSAA